MIYNYEEALDKIEAFMIESGIRNFCTSVCQGNCCGTCFASRKACHKNEGRRLSCSFYLCFSLEDLVFTVAERKIYEEVNMEIKTKLASLMEAELLRKNIYFDVHSKDIKEQFFIKRSVLNKLNGINKESVKLRASSIRNLHLRSSRFLVDKIKRLESGYDNKNGASRRNRKPDH